MSIFKKAVLTLACLALCAMSAHASASNIYLSQSGGTFSGGTACNGQTTQPYTFFNSSSNWGSGGNQIGAGTAVWICGTITGTNGTYGLNVLGNGTSANPVTIKFDTGAILQAGYWGGNPYTGGPGAIQCSGHSYITVDGGTNGIIQNTANGSASLGYANQRGSVGIYFACENFEVKNITVQSIYVHAKGDNGGIGNTAGIFGDADDTGCNIHNNFLVRDAYVGINVGYEGSPHALTSCTISYNTVNYTCQMIRSGDDGANASASNFVVSFNTLGPNQVVWQDAAGGCHTNLFFITNNSSGSLINGLLLNSNVLFSDGCSDRTGDVDNECSAFFNLGGSQSNVQIVNNLAYVSTSVGAWEAFVWFPQFPNSTDSNIVIANNTFNENNGGSGLSCSCAMIELEETDATDSQTGFNIQNNLFLNSSHEIYYNNDSTHAFSTKVTAMNRNGFQNVGGKFAEDFAVGGGTSYNTFSSWRAAGFDENSYNGNLGLSSFYIPQSGSSVVALGANLTSLGIAALDVDRNGTPRSPAWAAGAYQAVSSGAPAPPTAVSAIVQ